MSLAKRAQFLEHDNNPADEGSFNPFEELFNKEIDVEEDSEDTVELSGDDSEVSVELSIDEGEEEKPQTFLFSLPKLPGSIDDDYEDEDVGDLSVEEPEDEVEVEVAPRDSWDFGPLSNFLPWLAKMLENVPAHNRETSGLERAVSYLSAVNKSISRAVRSDLKDELDIAQIEKAREEIENGIERLEEELQKRNSKKKKASEFTSGMVKEAQKIAGVQGRIVVTVPLIISRVARTCINGMVSAGHDIEDLFDRQVKKYNFDIQQQAELMQLLEDMGYPLRRDRGFLRDEEIDRTRSDNFDWAANYPG